MFKIKAKCLLIGALTCCTSILYAQKTLDIADLWSLGRLGSADISMDKKSIVYTVSIPNIAENKSKTSAYSLDLNNFSVKDFAAKEGVDKGLDNAKISPDGKRIAYTKEVAIEKIKGSDKYSDLPKSNAYIFTDLNNRHWDEYEDGSYSHVFIADIKGNIITNAVDIMDGQSYDCPQKPHGGAEDICWSPDSKTILYVTKKLSGKAYALSTNTDIYAYDIVRKTTENLTQITKGYDQNPVFSPDGKTLAYLSMDIDGYESDKQEIVIMDWLTRTTKNITRSIDETVDGFTWANDSKGFYVIMPHKGTKQLFEIKLIPTIAPDTRNKKENIKPVSFFTKITNGVWDVNSIIAEKDRTLYVTRSDMNHANEIYKVDLNNGNMQKITTINDDKYAQISPCKIEPRYTKATDGADLFSWVVYPPNFDANKKYPILLYCQGGPQGSISQFYSFRWNFQLMASKGYIVVVPNRRGCQGWGTKWNEAISKDWGGQAINDYLSAYDAIAKEKYVDTKRAAAVGASYGGYSVFMLAGMHNNRFKSFIAHDGLFDLRSWYGNTEELFFANYDIGGPYWNKTIKSYEKHNPVNLVQKWNTPIMIVQGGKDYRVGVEQGLAAFQTAQLLGIKSKLLYLPEENHWVLKAQNAQVWQREFYSWLDETLK